MKYRPLSIEELKHFEKEFINFLAINGIEPQNWEHIKSEKGDRMTALLHQFSDLVFEKVLRQIQYLEHRTPKDLKVFHCLEDRIKLIGIVVDSGSSLDLTQKEWQGEILKAIQSGKSHLLRVYSAEKSYKVSREEELFEMVSSGCFIIDESLFQTLEQLQAS